MILCSAEPRIISCLPTHVINLVINDNSLEILYIYIYIYLLARACVRVCVCVSAITETSVVLIATFFWQRMILVTCSSYLKDANNVTGMRRRFTASSRKTAQLFTSKKYIKARLLIAL